MIVPYRDHQPDIEQAAYIAPSADIVGNVVLGAECTIWFNATVRGDMARITIGGGTNIQDNAVVHVNDGMPTVIGEAVTVGHGAIIHACTIGNRCLVGMGAIILDEAVIGEECLVAAGALVPPRKQFPPRSLIVGSPAKVARSLTDREVTDLQENARHYVQYGKEYASQKS
ncbi:MAG: gamma carbonic anhydrase family protein [Spirochaetae bacterium HGW-Spirochaetae-2]|jgi:carbonic anhydrase/acetyltransferase-like protein (isoleucine patch superfamily)|nr:MAG: gamma carbonic anhydrase family protein [Spirochaetae bacterium HGW-Spirochaetae-2]